MILRPNAVKTLSEYKIPYTGLKTGFHHFDFKLEEKFFSNFEFSQIHSAEIAVKVRLEKQSTMLVIDAELTGTILTECDRCGDDCTVNIKGSNRLIVKFGDHTDRIDDDILVLGPSEHQVDLSEYLYEFAHLALPLRKVHKNLADCNQEVLEKLNHFLVEEDDDENIEEEEV